MGKILLKKLMNGWQMSINDKISDMRKKILTDVEIEMLDNFSIDFEWLRFKKRRE